MSKLFLREKINIITRITYLCAILMSFCTATTFAQSFTVTGTVTDDSGAPLIGASVIVIGTGNGTVTDIDGKYSLSQITAESVLRFSFVGYTNQEITVGIQRVINATLSDDSQSLEELVVVGYGVQKKALVTGATLNVAGENIQRMSTTSAFTALQSQSPGVSILQSSGEPGSGYIVNIRGISTNGESRPLYVIDGIAAGHDGLDHISPSDIESIDILKDAASAAIYGARAANGVVLVTTRQGKAGKPRVTYDGYWGRQYMINKPEMLNAQQYMEIQDLYSRNIGEEPYNWATGLPTQLYNDYNSGANTGSDWIDAFYNKGAPTQSHAFNITGGNEISKYSVGYSNLSHTGAFGEKLPSDYNRHTFRLNSDHVILKNGDMEVVKFGQTLNYIFTSRRGMRHGDVWWNSFRGILNANPLQPIYNKDGGYYDYYDKIEDGGWVYDWGNPIGSYATGTGANNRNKSHNLNTSAFLQIQPIKNLVFRSQFGYRMRTNSSRNMDLISRFTVAEAGVEEESVNQSGGLGFNWTLDNTLSYSFSINTHSIDIQVGQAVEKSGYGENWGSGATNSNFNLGWDYGYVNNMTPLILSERSASGSPWGESALASFWGRVNYNYKETYMATLTMRADGSSNFARGKRWGYFPSVSAGWILSNESFLENAKGTLDFLRLRVSWGQNGNQSIANFQYLTRYNIGDVSDEYFFGVDKITPRAGASPSVYRNPDVTWETSEQTNVGIDARFLRNRLGIVFDWYRKDTKGWLLQAPISSTWGYMAPDMNGGAVRNTGVELSFNWNDRVGDFTYNLVLNGSLNTNVVTEISNPKGFIAGRTDILSISTPDIWRLEEGKPMGYFYGFVHDGVFQTPAEVQAHKNHEGTVIQPAAVPGDIRFKDLNGNGVLENDYDRTMIGNGHPKYLMGFTVNLGYKGFDLIVAASGRFDYDIMKSYRSYASGRDANFETSIYDQMWTGEGSTNFYPRFAQGALPNTANISKLFMENGDYLKIQNVTLGYDLKQLFPRMPLGQLRVYGTVNNLFTFTKYSGMDPEIGPNADFPSWVRSIDLGYYPSVRTCMMGVNVSF